MAVILTLTASGVVSDYTDTSNLQKKIADAAGVDVAFVSIRVAAASVIITASIRVPSSNTAFVVEEWVSSSFGTAADASALLGITVETTPTINVDDGVSFPPGASPPPASEGSVSEPPLAPRPNLPAPSVPSLQLELPAAVAAGAAVVILLLILIVIICVVIICVFYCCRNCTRTHTSPTKPAVQGVKV